ncbi:MAG TPA: NADH-quinone oxidoreductase subunit J [Gemmatimonadaceae bacterium]|nr:NADH-quinone oxidoreductase subunit J [Gemmatimonadaceae bacterium]
MMAGPGATPLFYTFFFYIFGLTAVAAGLVFVTRKSPVAAAMWLVVTMFAIAALYVMLDAQFIGAIQVMVYAGAIMVVFLFVIMLLNLGHPSQFSDLRSFGWKLAAGVVGLGIMAEIFTLTRGTVAHPYVLPAGFAAGQVAREGVIAPLAGPLFRQYLLAFELTSVVLLVAIVGAVVLGMRRTNAG